ncbi:hypothetical protein [Actinoplanes xinjiangensis]|uniref:hypothetical protein n=1 Tax=Actinoplanes xinjiangensis TaxID=512350 RepID=UPI0011B7EF6A|nr:hypothetical protein [Actinoplanes xinjiangensis]GIF45263.1 hypothetical protein Axi01nite_95740 [Actinoplanes xinjiangensis]
MANLEDLLAVYPWLARLGPDLLGQLDVAELAGPHPCALALGPTVVAYRSGASLSPGRIQLCSVVPVKQLSPARISVLKEAERTNPGIVLVQYDPQL